MSNAPRAAGVRRDWGGADDSCTILHVDMDAFYAAVEIADAPELAGLPIIVGGSGRSVVLSATYDVRSLGVRSAMPMASARRLAPGALVIPPRMHRYREVSREVMAILSEITPIVEQVSVDEAYLDVSGVRRHWRSASEIAQHLRERIAAELRVTCSVGVAPSKLIAKLASTNAKPDGLLVIPRNAEVEFVQSLPVGALPGVGARTQEALRERGIETVRELAQSDPASLRYWFGLHGGNLYDLAWARDRRGVDPRREELSIGSERTFAADTSDERELDRVLVALTDRVAGILRSRKVMGGVVVLKVKDAEFRVLSRSRQLPHPSSDAGILIDTLRQLWRESPAKGRLIRLVGVRVEQLHASAVTGVQGTLDDELAQTSVPRELVASAVDSVRDRFGGHVLAPASGLRRG
ncbi:DNA polymerase IV [Rarobacter faecitabidus]|uniref:DNA polymerase IV n=1 Tax=Rarobacter faecitabidus TaxID=13243 RepID=A0A542ZW90_RARFA|nr:DNA polymerase IV [Rarobacter faecitabidus]TQL64628.1 DNA polymerase-4 [Rarobacter faecitabidus]